MKHRLLFCCVLILTLLCVVSCGSKNKYVLETYLEETKKYPETIHINEVIEGIEIEITLEETEEEETISETEAETEIEADSVLGYIAPEGWYEPRFETGKVEGGGYKLIDDVMGLKVAKVQTALDMEASGYFNQETMDRVAFFQWENGMELTGSVNLETWLALGFSEEEWNTLGTYVCPVAIEKDYTAEQIREVFINTAKTYIETPTPFIVGASGKPGQGVDCSGLVLQCMYAIGIYPDGLSPVQHSVEEEYNSRLMWADPKLYEIRREELIPGDLVFYRRPYMDTVCHVAIYIGEGKCIEALYDVVEILPLDKLNEGYALKGFKRIISE